MEKYGYIVLNLEKYWERLCKQNKSGKNSHAFVRRGKVGPKNAKILIFYVTHPRKEIQGYAEFVEHVTGDAKELWNSLGHESLLSSYEEYQNFLQGRKKATFVRFKNLKELPNPVTIKEIEEIIKRKRIPQSGMYVSEEITKELLSKGGINIK